MNLEELREIAAAAREKAASLRHCLRVCTAASCKSSGADDVKSRLDVLADEHRDAQVRIKGVGCLGLCSAGPLVGWETMRDASEVLYQQVQAADALDVYASLSDGPIERLRCPTDVPFFTRQQKVVLENSGRIDPEQIDDYIAADGYTALVTRLTERSPDEILREVNDSGLRGRGGGGYPAGLKWAVVAMSPEPLKYVICNADEGDPGRSWIAAVLESDPHRSWRGWLWPAMRSVRTRLYLHPCGISAGGRATCKRRFARHATTVCWADNFCDTPI